MRFFHLFYLSPNVSQGPEVDVLKAYSLIVDTINAEKQMRENLDNEWNDQLWPKILKVAESIEVLEEDFKPPRTVGRQTRRVLTLQAGLLPKSFFKISIAIPTLDHVVSALSTRFGKDQLRIGKLLTLNPQIMKHKSEAEIEDDLQEVIGHFNTIFDEDSVNLLHHELAIMLSILKRREEEGSPLQSLMDLFKDSEGTLITINKLAQIVLTYPVTSNERERSFSVLRRLYSWLKTFMGTNRLCSLGRIVWLNILIT